MKKQKTYKIKEIHYTLQGEGANAGLPMVLVRFTGCNVWNGREEDRDKHAHKGMCALWCDTDFKDMKGENGGKYTATELLEKVKELGSFQQRWDLGKFSVGVGGTGRLRTVKGIVLFTGGEPFLQVDQELAQTFLEDRIDVAIESNGSRDISPALEAYKQSTKPSGLLWLTISPKPPMPLHQSVLDYGVNELKVVLDTKWMHPKDYDHVSAREYFVQPLDHKDDELNMRAMENVCEYVMENPKWRVSCQQHKLWRLP